MTKPVLAASLAVCWLPYRALEAVTKTERISGAQCDKELIVGATEARTDL